MKYPKAMIHPHARKGTSTPVVYRYPGSDRTVTDYRGTPDVFPPVTVENEDQEEEHRAKGYIGSDEEMPKMTPHREYPLWMKHPDFVPAVPGTEDRPMIPAKYDDVMVSSEAEEDHFAGIGYRRPGTSDPDAVQAASAAPYVPGRVAQEFPKMVGEVVVDPSAPTGEPLEYPKWVGGADGQIVNSRTEELALLGQAPAPEPLSHSEKIRAGIARRKAEKQAA